MYLIHSPPHTHIPYVAMHVHIKIDCVIIYEMCETLSATEWDNPSLRKSKYNQNGKNCSCAWSVFALQNEIIKVLCEFVHKMIFQTPLKTHLLQLLCNAHSKLNLFLKTISVVNVFERVCACVLAYACAFAFVNFVPHIV